MCMYFVLLFTRAHVLSKISQAETRLELKDGKFVKYINIVSKAFKVAFASNINYSSDLNAMFKSMIFNGSRIRLLLFRDF